MVTVMNAAERLRYRRRGAVDRIFDILLREQKAAATGRLAPPGAPPGTRGQATKLDLYDEIADVIAEAERG